MVPGSEGTSDNVGMGSKSIVNGKGWTPPLLPRASREPTISHQNLPSPAQFHLPKSSPTSILSSSPVFSSPLHKTETDRLMSSELGDQRFVKGGIVGGVGGVGPEPENVQCPRCESTNTKFCYYNNYNLSQPRYFCKACRRYWTRGGTLRNIPVGGGSRKNSKRSRPANSHPPPTQPPPQLHATPPSVSFGAPGDVNLNESLPPASFSSPLAPQSRLQQESPFLGLGGYGLGSGFDGLEFGPGDDGVVSTHHDQEPQSECNAWQVGETDGGDCFGWPMLAMSTPGTARLEHSFWPAN